MLTLLIGCCMCGQRQRAGSGNGCWPAVSEGGNGGGSSNNNREADGGRAGAGRPKNLCPGLGGTKDSDSELEFQDLPTSMLAFELYSCSKSSGSGQLERIGL